MGDAASRVHRLLVRSFRMGAGMTAPQPVADVLDAETVERCARAMCVHDGLDPDEHIIGGQATGFEDFGPLWQAEQQSEGQIGITDYVGLARVALRAAATSARQETRHGE